MSSINFSLPSKLPLHLRPKSPHLRPRRLLLRPLAASQLPTPPAPGDDFITRVLKQNPTQVEPKFLVGDRLLTLREKQQQSADSRSFTLLPLIKRFLRDGGGGGARTGEAEAPVYLKDILTEFKGKLYVPEEMFKESLSEEAEFERNLQELPIMEYDDFRKHMKAGKIKLLTSKSPVMTLPGIGYRNFVVDLVEIPGDKSIQKTKWATKLTADQAREVMAEYKGPQYEIEKHTTSYVGKLLEYPHPVASSISSRMMVELGMVTALIAAAAAVIAGFIASAAFAATSFLYATAVYVIWPIARPFLRLGVGIISSIAERIGDYVVDFFGYGGFFSKMYEIYTFGGLSSSLEMLKPILLVFGTMVLLIRFTLSRRPKNFRKWDIWQGIEFGQSKPQARVDGSTGVLFSDVAGIDEAVEELQEIQLTSWCDT